MTNKTKFLSCVFVVIGLSSSCTPRRGDNAIQTWESANQGFRVRVTEYDEKSTIVLPHYYYSFEAAPKGSGDWREIVTVRVDQSIPIPREQVRFLSDRIAYLFMLGKYAVTTDGGSSWHAWDAKQSGLDERFIRDLKIDPEGGGTMTLVSGSNNTDVIEFQTQDYGRTWTIK